MRQKNIELVNEVTSIRSQIDVIKQSFPSCDTSSQHKVERKLSIVLIGVDEAMLVFRQIEYYMTHLDCCPVAVYRMGRLVPNKNRILKIVFPSSYFASLVVKRAPLLRGGHILDLLLCNTSDVIVKPHVSAPVGTSDHASIISGPVSRLELNEFSEKYDYSKASYALSKEYLSSFDSIGSFQSSQDVETMYETFLFILKHCIALFVPILKVLLSRPNLPTYLAHFHNMKIKAYKRAISTQQEEDREHYRWAAKKFEKKLLKYNLSVEKRQDGTLVVPDNDKAEMLAKIFQKAYAKQSVSIDSRLVHGNIPHMEDFVWFSPSLNGVVLLPLPQMVSHSFS
ncbi:hypothetical protein COOONC_00514 [Cooperia oncophora]